MLRLIGLCFTLMFSVKPALSQNSDFNGNGAVDIDDFFKLMDFFGTTERTYDLDIDGQVSYSDVLHLLYFFQKSSPQTELTLTRENQSIFAKETLQKIGYSLDEDGIFKALAVNDHWPLFLFFTTGVDPNIKLGELRETPLHMAAWQNKLERARFLLDHGALIEEKRLGDDTPLYFALVHGHIEMVRLLIDRGADLYTEVAGGFTVLSYAVYRNDFDIVSLLFQKGFDPDFQDSFGQTPLFSIQIRTDIAIVKILIDNGIDVNVISSGGATALSVAVSGPVPIEIIELLLEAGADPNIGQMKEYNPDTEQIEAYSHLAWAAKTGNLEIVNLLLDKGAICSCGVPELTDICNCE